MNYTTQAQELKKSRKSLLLSLKKPTATDDRSSKDHKHPDHTANLSRLKKVQGQISGIEKMILNRRTSIDILIQFKAVSSALKAIEGEIFKTYLSNGVKAAVAANNQNELNSTVEELVDLLVKRL